MCLFQIFFWYVKQIQLYGTYFLTLMVSKFTNGFHNGAGIFKCLWNKEDLYLCFISVQNCDINRFVDILYTNRMLFERCKSITFMYVILRDKLQKYIFNNQSHKQVLDQDTVRTTTNTVYRKKQQQQCRALFSLR